MTSRILLLLVLVTGSLAAAADKPASNPKSSKPQKRLNVLFVLADDLRPELSSYGSPAKTPVLDGLARRGVQFNRAYCQQAVCNPSRSSLLTGQRPDTLGLWNNGTHFRERRPDVLTLPQWFLQHGYVTRNVGKIFHNWHTKERGDRRSWSADEFLYYENHGSDRPVVDGERPQDFATAPRCETRDVPDEAFFDGRVAQEAVRVLDEIHRAPFFLAVGFWKPHAPFNAPKKYWDLYSRSGLPALNPARPDGAPELAFHDGRELRGLPPKQFTFTAQEAEELRHGYFANTSYMDAQLGRVLAGLDRLGLADSTVIVFAGDHGYHLGEHGLWAKTSCFELDARVPLLIVPPQCAQAGQKSDALVELVDLFPTLVELCGLPAPDQQCDGQSLTSLLRDPTARVKAAAFSQHPRPAYFDRTPKGVPDAMGLSARTDRLRYTEWRDWQTGAVLARELYDHQTDPAETRNRIDDPALSDGLNEARTRLHAEFPPAIPPSRRG